MSTGDVCDSCGLDYDTISPPDAKVAIRSYPRRFRAALAAARDDEGDEGLIRRRPDPTTWSALEYTAHVADVFQFIAGAIRRMYDEDAPSLDSWDFEARIDDGRANDADPAVVIDRLAAEAERVVEAMDRVDPDGWHRTATFPFGERDILRMARNAVHEGSHHLRDVERVLDQARRAR